MSDSIDSPRFSNVPLVNTASGLFIMLMSGDPSGSQKVSGFAISQSEFAATFGGGTVTSVGLTGSNGITVTGAPITGSGSFSIAVDAVALKAHLAISSADITNATASPTPNTMVVRDGSGSISVAGVAASGSVSGANLAFTTSFTANGNSNYSDTATFNYTTASRASHKNALILVSEDIANMGRRSFAAPAIASPATIEPFNTGRYDSVSLPETSLADYTVKLPQPLAIGSPLGAINQYNGSYWIHHHAAFSTLTILDHANNVMLTHLGVCSVLVRENRDEGDTAFYTLNILTYREGEIAIQPKGPYNNDAAAALAGIPIGGLYYQTGGTVHIRLT